MKALAWPCDGREREKTKVDNKYIIPCEREREKHLPISVRLIEWIRYE